MGDFLESLENQGESSANPRTMKKRTTRNRNHPNPKRWAGWSVAVGALVLLLLLIIFFIGSDDNSSPGDNPVALQTVSSEDNQEPEPLTSTPPDPVKAETVLPPQPVFSLMKPFAPIAGIPKSVHAASASRVKQVKNIGSSVGPTVVDLGLTDGNNTLVIVRFFYTEARSFAPGDHLVGDSDGVTYKPIGVGRSSDLFFDTRELAETVKLEAGEKPATTFQIVDEQGRPATKGHLVCGGWQEPLPTNIFMVFELPSSSRKLWFIHGEQRFVLDLPTHSVDGSSPDDENQAEVVAISEVEGTARLMETLPRRQGVQARGESLTQSEEKRYLEVQLKVSSGTSSSVLVPDEWRLHGPDGKDFSPLGVYFAVQAGDSAGREFLSTETALASMISVRVQLGAAHQYSTPGNINRIHQCIVPTSRIALLYGISAKGDDFTVTCGPRKWSVKLAANASSDTQPKTENSHAQPKSLTTPIGEFVRAERRSAIKIQDPLRGAVSTLQEEGLVVVVFQPTSRSIGPYQSSDFSIIDHENKQYQPHSITINNDPFRYSPSGFGIKGFEKGRGLGKLASTKDTVSLMFRRLPAETGKFRLQFQGDEIEIDLSQP